jgi:hypothetical protein
VIARFRPGKTALCAAPVAAVLAFFWPATASADVSSWLFTGAGPSWTREGKDVETGLQPMFQLDLGMGTPPNWFLSFGAIGRMQTHFGEGTDLGLLFRTATQGYTNGDWGAALDFGGYQRWWGIGSTGWQGSLNLGAPWGITISGSYGAGTNDQRAYSAVVGIDFARLTIYRTTGDKWWKNPFPAYRPHEENR